MSDNQSEKQEKTLSEAADPVKTSGTTEGEAPPLATDELAQGESKSINNSTGQDVRAQGRMGGRKHTREEIEAARKRKAERDLAKAERERKRKIKEERLRKKEAKLKKTNKKKRIAEQKKELTQQAYEEEEKLIRMAAFGPPRKCVYQPDVPLKFGEDGEDDIVDVGPGAYKIDCAVDTNPSDPGKVDRAQHILAMRLTQGVERPPLPGQTAFRIFFLLQMFVAIIYCLYRVSTFLNNWTTFTFFWLEFPFYMWNFISSWCKWTNSDNCGWTPSLSQVSQIFKEEDWPVISMTIPTYDETPGILQPVIEGACQMDWPREKLWLWVCDDGGRKEIRALTVMIDEKFGMQGMLKYIGRRKLPGVPHHAKAGNLNNIFQKEPGHPDRIIGQFIAVFDADMKPHPQFFHRVVPLFYYYIPEKCMFKANHIALVQTPQCFTNVVESDWLDHHQGAWYHGALCGWDYHEAIPFCGSNAMLRLETILGLPNNGIPYGSITEDLHTSLQFMVQGWRSRYVREKLGFGVAPLNFGDTIDQRSRWTTGALQMVDMEWYNLLTHPTMPVKIKVCFWMLGGSPYLMLCGILATLILVACIFFSNHTIAGGPLIALPDDAWTLPASLHIHYAGMSTGAMTFALQQLSCLFSPGTIPLFLRWRSGTSFITYVPCCVFALWCTWRGEKTPFKTTDKGGGDVMLWAGSFHDPANYFHVWYLVILFGAMLWGLVAIVDRWDLVLVYHHVLEWTWIVFNIVTSYDVIFLLTVPLPMQDQWEGERRAKSPLYLDPPRLNPRRMDLMQMYPEKYLNDLRKNFNPINVWPDPLMTVYPPMPGFEVPGYGSIKPYPQMEFAEPWLYQSLEVERGDPFWDEMLCNPSYHEFENVDISVIPEARPKKELRELDFATLALVDCGLIQAPVLDLDEEEAIRRDSEPVAGSSDSEPEEMAPLLGASDSTTTRLLPSAQTRADQGSRQGFLTRIPTFMPRASSANTELKQMKMTPGRGYEPPNQDKL